MSIIGIITTLVPAPPLLPIIFGGLGLVIAGVAGEKREKGAIPSFLFSFVPLGIGIWGAFKL